MKSKPLPGSGRLVHKKNRSKSDLSSFSFSRADSGSQLPRQDRRRRRRERQPMIEYCEGERSGTVGKEAVEPRTASLNLEAT